MASCPEPMACFTRAADIARRQQAQRLVRLADEAAQELKKSGNR